MNYDKENNFEGSYSWSDMANALTSHNIPHEVVRTLADVPMAIIMKRPILNMFKFDDYLHEQYGDYESEGKSMKDMFDELFGNDANKIAYYFGLGKNEWTSLIKINLLLALYAVVDSVKGFLLIILP